MLWLWLFKKGSVTVRLEGSWEDWKQPSHSWQRVLSDWSSCLSVTLQLASLFWLKEGATNQFLQYIHPISLLFLYLPSFFTKSLSFSSEWQLYLVSVHLWSPVSWLSLIFLSPVQSHNYKALSNNAQHSTLPFVKLDSTRYNARIKCELWNQSVAVRGTQAGKYRRDLPFHCVWQSLCD